MTEEKPSILILGGCGFIGRNLVHYLVSHNHAETIRVVDKVLPALAWLNPAHKEAFKQVEFKHANLIKPNSVAQAFSTQDGRGFDYVINCAAETKLGQTDAVYHDGIYTLSCLCAEQAERAGVKRYIELSESRIKSSDKVALTEGTRDLDPWTAVARYKLQVEEHLRTHLSNLNYVIIRPALVYGLGDKSGISKRFVIAGVYKHLGEKLQMLWSKDLHMNTVHVHDVARAIWHVCTHGDARETYNLADHGNTCQGEIGDMISELFNLNYEYLSSVTLSMAKLQLSEAEMAEEVNDKHLEPWGQLCMSEGITNTPLSPFVTEEHLIKKELYVDGKKIERTGFVYERPKLTKQLLKEVLDDFVDMKLFPRSLVT